MLWLKRHVCNKCNKRFSKVEELMQHIQVMHSNERYYCFECNTYFDNMSELRAHLSRYHPYNK